MQCKIQTTLAIAEGAECESERTGIVTYTPCPQVYDAENGAQSMFCA